MRHVLVASLSCLLSLLLISCSVQNEGIKDSSRKFPESQAFQKIVGPLAKKEEIQQEEQTTNPKDRTKNDDKGDEKDNTDSEQTTAKKDSKEKKDSKDTEKDDKELKSTESKSNNLALPDDFPKDFPLPDDAQLFEIEQDEEDGIISFFIEFNFNPHIDFDETFKQYKDYADQLGYHVIIGEDPNFEDGNFQFGAADTNDENFEMFVVTLQPDDDTYGTINLTTTE